MPDKVVIHWVIIKEPNKFMEFKGRIYILAESAGESNSNVFTRFFGYSKERIEPRLYSLKYSRELHEQLQKGVMPSLRKGQPVAGRLTKNKKQPKAGLRPAGVSGKGKGKGSESQEQEWHFHKLLPSEIHEKPE